MISQLFLLKNNHFLFLHMIMKTLMIQILILTIHFTFLPPSLMVPPYHLPNLTPHQHSVITLPIMTFPHPVHPQIPPPTSTFNTPFHINFRFPLLLPVIPELDTISVLNPSLTTVSSYHLPNYILLKLSIHSLGSFKHFTAYCSVANLILTFA